MGRYLLNNKVYDTKTAEDIVEVLNDMCYGISIAEEIKAKEKVSISDQTIC